MKCDLNCPATGSIFLGRFCCHNCSAARKYYVKESNKHLWNEEKGFFEEGKGCRLSRAEMPQECKEYDCHKKSFYICELKYSQLVWNEKWVKKKPVTLFVRGEVNEGHFDNLFEQMKKDIARFSKNE